MHPAGMALHPFSTRSGTQVGVRLATTTMVGLGLGVVRVRVRVRGEGDYFLRLHTPFSIVGLAR